jgi:hypothetical protein
MLQQKQKEKRAADERFKFLVTPPAIVAPEREIPGNRARAW